MREFGERKPSFFQKPWLKLSVSGLGIAGMLAGGCVARGNNSENTSFASKAENQLPFSAGQAWYYTSGPHGDSFSGDIAYSITLTVPEFSTCPAVSKREVLAIADGTVILAGDANKASPNRNRVKERLEDGSVIGYGRLEDIRVKVGQKVAGGDPLGLPSCVPEIGGEIAKTVGVQIFVQDANGPEPITGFAFDGFRVVGGQPWSGLLREGKIEAVASSFRCAGSEIKNPNTCGNTTNAVTER